MARNALTNVHNARFDEPTSIQVYKYNMTSDVDEVKLQTSAITLVINRSD